MNSNDPCGRTTSLPRVLVIAGPTASGKSALAMAIAAKIPAAIIGCDSVQVYRGFDIGSAKATIAEQAEVPHHLIDVVAWNETYDAAQYARDAQDAIRAAIAHSRLPIVVGGSGLYLRALMATSWHDDVPKDPAIRARLANEPTQALAQQLLALDPVRAAAIHPNDRFRLTRALEIIAVTGGTVSAAWGTSPSSKREFQFLVVRLDPARDLLRARIAERVTAMLNLGFCEEVEALLAGGCSPGCKPMQSIGYAQVVAYLAGPSASSLAALPSAIATATSQYAKRQSTWNKKILADHVITSSTPTESAAILELINS